MTKNRYFKNEFLWNLEKNASLVVFDLNGLIIDDEELQRRAVNEVLKPYGIELSEQDWILECVGTRADRYLKRILKKVGISPGSELVSNLIEEKNRIYELFIAGQAKKLTRPGVESILGFFSRERSVQLAVATSALPAEMESILGDDGLGIKEHFDYIITGADVSRSKPDPETYNILTDLSGTHPSASLVFEDSGPGIAASARAGIPCIAVPNRYTAGQDFSLACCVIDNLTPDAKVLSIHEH
jgi:HAD superfamily hydrolase (TIGR01509 family)